MLPKHQSECNLEPPYQKAYFENQFGAKSIGEPSWKPHIRNALDCPNCQEHSPKGGNGLDWFSSIRCPEPVKPENGEQPTFEKKTPTEEHVRGQVDKEKQSSCKERGEEQDSCMIYEKSLEHRMGRRRKVQDVRNGINRRAPGDKNYFTVEYERGFHNLGSTLPVVNFGSLKTVPDTFIPLAKLPLQPRISFHTKEKMEEKANEINEVKKLDFWRPADPLH